MSRVMGRDDTQVFRRGKPKKRPACHGLASGIAGLAPYLPGPMIPKGPNLMRALILGSSGGIGRALYSALAEGGAEVTGLSRRDHGLDMTDEASIRAALAPLTAPL